MMAETKRSIHRPLAGLAVGISISESEDSAARGCPPESVNRVVSLLIEALIPQGARVVLGHDWRPEGVMGQALDFAQRYGETVSSEDAPQPKLTNLVPWPDRPHLDREDRDILADVLRVEEAGLPVDLKAYEGQSPSPKERDSDACRYLRARGLTHLRRRLTALTHARICIGGRLKGWSGRYPGIVEEALLAARHAQPLYLCGMLGGATAQIIDAIRGKPCPEGFCSNGDVANLYERNKAMGEGAAGDDTTIDPLAVWESFREMGVEGLAKHNHLTGEENNSLFDALDVDGVIRFVLPALARVASGT